MFVSLRLAAVHNFGPWTVDLVGRDAS